MDRVSVSVGLANFPEGHAELEVNYGEQDILGATMSESELRELRDGINKILGESR